MKRKWLLYMLTVMTAIMLVACGTDDKKDETASDAGTADEVSEFRIGMEAGYAPFNWTQQGDANGAVKIADNAEYAGGYDVQMAKKIAEGLGKELVIVKMEWDGLVPALQSEKIDAIIAGMSPTEERKQTIDFTDNYYTSDFVMVVKKGSKYENVKSIQDFSGAKVTSQLNTSNYGVIDQIKGVNKQTAMESFPAMRVALEAGKIDGYVAERPEGISAQAANDKFTFVSFSDYVMVVKKGSKFENAKTKQDFEGAKVTAQLNTSNYDNIDQIKGVNKQTAMDSPAAMREALEAGEIDGYVAERSEGSLAQDANANVKVVSIGDGFDTDIANTSIAVGIRKGDANTAKINEVLQGISEEDRQKMMEDAISQQPAAQ